MSIINDAIKIGDVVSGLEPSELVEVRSLSPFGGKTLLEGVTLQTRREIKKPLTDQELSRLVRVRARARHIRGEWVDVDYLSGHNLLEDGPFWKLAQALFEVLPRDLEDWKLVSALLGERGTLRSEGKQRQGISAAPEQLKF